MPFWRDKMSGYFRTGLFLFFPAVFLVAGCSGKGGMYASEALYGDAGQARSVNVSEAADEKEGGEADGGGQYADPGGTDRKLVKRANLRIRMEDPGAVEQPLAAALNTYGAYLASGNIRENSRNYSIRVPSASYDMLLAELAGLGRVLNRSESAEDVTLRYYDLEGRLATKRELLKTFQAYLGKAQNIEEILSVEERIAELQGEIDGTGKELRNLAGLIDYSTIDLEITGPVSAVSHAAPSFGERVKELIGSFGEFLSTALLVLIGIVIYGVPVLFFITLLFWLLFGRLGLLKKIWRAAAGNGSKTVK